MATNVREKNDATIKPKKEKPRPSATPPSAAARDNLFTRAARYLREVQVELKKTTWPSKAELFASTQVVIGLLVVVGLFIWVVDMMLGVLFNAAGLGIGKT